MQDAAAIQGIESRYAALASLMDERMRRQWAAAEAKSYGWGGSACGEPCDGNVAEHDCQGARSNWMHERSHPETPLPERLRKPGAGRKCAVDADPELAAALERLVDPATRGDPMSPLRWTCKSTTQLAGELTRQGHPVSPRTVGRLLKAAGYSLQSNRKTKEGKDHPDRNAQFEHINASVLAFQERGQPVISIDTKKKELVGKFRNGGREWQPQGEPEEVLVHDFMDKELGKAIPYGVYDITENQGWVSVGIDHDTARFAVGSDSSMVEEDGIEASSWCEGTADYGGRWRKQWESLPSVEGGVAGSGQPFGDADSCLSFPAGHQQMEQDRTSDVLPHHPKLARPSARQPRGDRQPDRQHRDGQGTQDPTRNSTPERIRSGSRLPTTNSFCCGKDFG